MHFRIRNTSGTRSISAARAAEVVRSQPDAYGDDKRVTKRLVEARPGIAEPDRRRRADLRSPPAQRLR
jgi:hypothetical protein